MVETLVGFAGIALLVSITPGPATALVVRSAALHGRRQALHVVLGNSTGIVMWALASVLGISALIAASEPVLLTTLAMALLLIAVDLVYFTLLAIAVARARRAVVGSAVARRVERLTGAVMVGLGIRVALERR